MTGQDSDASSDTGIPPSATPEPIPESLLTYLERAIGGNLRSVAHYDRDSVSIEINETLRGEVDEERVQQIIDDLRLQDIGQQRQVDLYNVGELYCTVRAFDDALILHFIQGNDRGTLVSLAPETAPGLTDFIYDVLNILHTDSEQEIPRAPNWSADDGLQ